LLRKKAEIQASLAVLEARQRQLDFDERRRLYAQVGKLADAAGLLTYDLGVLEKAFARLGATLREEQVDA
jgi:hypothetical protein